MNHIKKENCNTLYFFKANDRNVHHDTVNKTHHLTIKNVCFIVVTEIKRISTNITSL